jgi:hypothetical protein
MKDQGNREQPPELPAPERLCLDDQLHGNPRASPGSDPIGPVRGYGSPGSVTMPSVFAPARRAAPMACATTP